MAQRRALVTGVTGQDGTYLTDLLLAKGYEVHGLRRYAASAGDLPLARLPGRLSVGREGALHMHYGDVGDAARLARLIEAVQPDEIYNLAAQSHVQVSFDTPVHTGDVNALGVVRLLEAVRTLGLAGRTRIYQASTSELFGAASEWPQRETTPFRPRSPYGAAKLYGYWIAVTYREAHGLHVSNGILFNHESPIRSDAFVSRKITRAAAAVAVGGRQVLRLGNLEARRDWGHARDYVEGMWLMLQQDGPDDYVLATGADHTVRDFADLAFRVAGRPLVWQGNGAAEEGRCAATGEVLVAVDPRLYRPAEVDRLVGEASKARKRLGWRHRIGFADLVREMVEHDMAALRGSPG